MRKIFSQRARVVVYLENEAVDRMLAQAKSEGKTLVEWARDALLGELNDPWVAAERAEKRVLGHSGVRVVRRGSTTKGRVVSDVRHAESGGSAHAHAEKVVREASAAENPESGSVDAEIARKSGHPLGCDCAWVCGRMRRMMK